MDLQIAMGLACTLAIGLFAVAASVLACWRPEGTARELEATRMPWSLGGAICEWIRHDDGWYVVAILGPAALIIGLHQGFLFLADVLGWV